MTRSGPLAPYLLCGILSFPVAAAPAGGIEAKGGAKAGAGDTALVLAPEDTIILDFSTYAGQFLQYYLIKGFAGAEAAAPYKIDSKIDRAASPHFPLFREDGKRLLPEGKKIIAVGETRFLSPEDKKRLEENPGAILLKRQGDVVVVVAGSPLSDGWGGSFAAMAKFLDVCAGIRFYAPGDLWVSRPKAKRRPPEGGKPETPPEGGTTNQGMRIGELDLFRKQTFASSGLGQYIERNGEWLRMNPNANRLTLRAMHSLGSIFASEKYGKSHPEIYPMKGGQRAIPAAGSTAWNPCLSAKSLPDLAMQHVRAQFKGGRSPSYISFGVMDCLFDCECPDCQKSVREYDGSYSNLYYTFLNEVARRCQAEFPRLLLTAYVYSNVRRPPVGMRIEPNIVVDVVVKSYRWVIAEALEAEKRRIREFSDLGARWLIHDWCFSGVSPRSNSRQIAGFLQWAAQNHMVGAYFEWSPGEAWYLDGCKYWLLMQLMSDPYQDVDLLWKQYCDDMYGPASETMYRFFAHFADKNVYAPGLIELRDLPREEPALFTEEDLATERGLLEKAIAQTKDDPLVQQRLAMVMRYFVGHELFAKAVAEPYRLNAQFKGPGINRAALAYYVNEPGNRLAEAVDYYLHKRTIPPDSEPVNLALGALPSYINNCTRAKSAILSAIRGQAMEKILSQDRLKAGLQTGPKTVGEIVAEAKAILRANLPEKFREEKVKEFEDCLGQIAFVPTVGEMPKIDGLLDDAIWEKAASLENWTERDTLARSPHRTSGKILRVGDRLVLGIVCRQAGPVWAKTAKEVTTGTSLWRESAVEVFFGKSHQGAACAQYIVNALGAVRGFALAADNREGVEAAVTLDAEKNVYTIEAALPLKAKGYDFTRDKVLSFNLMRDVYTRDSFAADVLIGWAPIFATAQDSASRGFILMR